MQCVHAYIVELLKQNAKACVFVLCSVVCFNYWFMNKFTNVTCNFNI